MQQKQYESHNIPRSTMFGHHFGSSINAEEWKKMVDKARELQDQIQAETDYSKRNAMTMRKRAMVQRITNIVFDHSVYKSSSGFNINIKKEMRMFLEAFCADMGYDFKEMRKTFLRRKNAGDDE